MASSACCPIDRIFFNTAPPARPHARTLCLLTCLPPYRPWHPPSCHHGAAFALLYPCLHATHSARALPDAHASVAHGGLCGPPCQPGPQRQDRQRPTSPRPQQQPRHHHCQLRALTVDPSPNDSGCNSWLGPASRSVSRHLQRPCHARPHPCHPAEPRKSPSRPVHPVHVLPKCHRNPCLSSRCPSE